ncbi:hypothetical protein B7494_g6211 [Chlorociboria aeruginascens]|nr:hypothetical protein B7494_g6211 [Chlorociboria aeruginascens]
MPQSEEKADADSITAPSPNEDSEFTLSETKEFAPIRHTNSKPITRLNSQTRPTSLRSMSRIRSNNGFGCDDSADDDNADLEGGGDAQEKDEYEVQWDGDNDPMNPRSMAIARKWLLVIIIEMKTSVRNNQEFYGRRPIYIVSFSFFLIWIIPSAVARNIQTMLIARFFDGIAGSAFLSVAGGTVGDLFDRSQLQAPMMIYTASPFVGPSIGPLLGGFINQYTSWRWTFYVLIIWAGANLGMIVLLVPETYHPVVLRNKARKLRKETGDDRWKAPMEKTNKSITKTIGNSLLRPGQLLIFEPMCTNLCLFSAILLGILYLFFGAFPLVFEGNHGFTLSQVGLSFLGIFVGMIFAISTDPLWHKNYVRLIKQREEATGEIGGSEPEYRLPPAILGALLVPAGLFMFAWTTYSSVHWIVPIIGSAIFGMGSCGGDGLPIVKESRGLNTLRAMHVSDVHPSVAGEVQCVQIHPKSSCHDLPPSSNVPARQHNVDATHTSISIVILNLATISPPHRHIELIDDHPPSTSRGP